MVRPPITCGRIAMTRHHNFGLHLGRTLKRVVKVVYLEPQQHAVAVRFVVAIADRSVMVFDLEPVQLHDQHTVGFKSLVLRTAVRAPTAKESLIPLAAGFDVGHCDKWLWSHRSSNCVVFTSNMMVTGRATYGRSTTNIEAP